VVPELTHHFIAPLLPIAAPLGAVVDSAGVVLGQILTGRSGPADTGCANSCGSNTGPGRTSRGTLGRSTTLEKIGRGATGTRSLTRTGNSSFATTGNIEEVVELTG